MRSALCGETWSKEDIWKT